jgi:hypothetical protein
VRTCGRKNGLGSSGAAYLADGLRFVKALTSLDLRQGPADPRCFAAFVAQPDGAVSGIMTHAFSVGVRNLEVQISLPQAGPLHPRSNNLFAT